mmetsp:Transcript_19551/g.28124  ORF Transcript_19551/g.28124 Transcript_19551/m.28124 type:complete len:297 (+) Transcript_19551:228-1118(+)
MEMMMAAQLEAKKKDDECKRVEREKDAKTGFAGGFKKGFLGSGSSKSTKKGKTPVSSASSAPPLPSPSSGKEEMPTIKPSAENSGSGSLVMDDVQQAMKEDTNPLLQKIKQGEWATPELMNQLQDNPILARGLSNPKCMAALTLLQSDPKEAKRRFEGDPDVSAFLQEFGRVMSTHFTALGEAQGQQQGQEQQQQNKGPVVQELGPLHAEALARQKQQNTGSNTAVSVAEGCPDDSERVKEIVQNDELRALLMDVELQQILKECNDPVKFRQHMSNPVTARKIKTLYEAGLVGTTK